MVTIRCASKNNNDVPQRSMERPIKSVFIIGKQHNLKDYKMGESLPSEDVLVIGNGRKHLDKTYIAEELEKHKLDIAPDAKIFIDLHGHTRRRGKGDYTAHNTKMGENTEEILSAVHDHMPPLSTDQIFRECTVFSCFGGTMAHLSVPAGMMVFALGSRPEEIIIPERKLPEYAQSLQQDRADFLSKMLHDAETVHILKKTDSQNDLDVTKIRRPKTEGDYAEAEQHFKGEWKKLCKASEHEAKETDFDQAQYINNSAIVNGFRGKKSQFEHCLQNGHDPCHTDHRGLTSSHYLIEKGHDAVWDSVLEHYKNDREGLIELLSTQEGKHGNSVLYHMAHHNRQDMWRKTLDIFKGHENELAEALKIPNNLNGMTPLHQITLSGSEDMWLSTMALVQQNKNLLKDLIQIEDHFGRTVRDCLALS